MIELNSSRLNLESKVCKDCGQEKPADAFKAWAPYYAKRMANKPQACLSCMKSKKRQADSDHYNKNREARIRYSNQYYLNNKQKYVDSRLKTKYGVSREQFDVMFAKQNGRCAICGDQLASTTNQYCTDHDHRTMKFRGILCRHCNFGIGHFKDNITSMYRAIEYIKENS